MSAPSPAAPRAPLEAKVKRGGIAGLSTGAIAALIVSLLPASVPDPVKAAVPAAVALIAYFITAYLAPHTHSPAGADAIAAVTRTLATVHEYQKHDRYARVNVQQIADLLDPHGMWSHSFAAVGPPPEEPHPAGEPDPILGTYPVTARPPDPPVTPPPGA
jgi:hypothetical protein